MTDRGELGGVVFPSGTEVPRLGQGTWHMGEDVARRADELAALRTGLDLGMTLVDTAEMYGAGAAEELVGEAVRGRRDEAFLVTKVLPSNADARGTVESCHASLRRLGTDRIDLYLLHWRGATPLAETVDAFEALVREGSIRSWGVSNFDADDLAELDGLLDGGRPQTDQILYNLSRRGPEFELLPACRARSLPVMAYSPVEQGRLLDHRTVRGVASHHDASPAQVALAWVLRHDDVIAIPKAGTVEHVEDNFAALDLRLTDQDLDALEEAFPTPTASEPLDVL